MANIQNVVVPGITGNAWVDLGSNLSVVGQSDYTGTATVASQATANLATIDIKAATVTLTGTTEVTTAQGAVTVGIVTLTDSMAVTVDSFASLYVAGPPVAAGSVTLTTPSAVNIAAGRLIHTPTRTVASATSAEISGHHIASATITLTGTTEVTTATGFVRIGTPTLTDSMAVTVDTYATFYVAAPPTAAGSVTLTSAYAIWVDSGNVRFDGNLTVSGGTLTYSAAATSAVVIANTAAAYRIYDGTTAIINVDTRNTVTGVVGVTISASAPTIASAAGDTFSQMSIAAKTITLTGTTGVTALDGIGLKIGTPTITNSMAQTTTTVSNLYVQKIAAAGGMAVITNSYIINTDVAGCFLTNAGVWTDASSEEHKQDIATVTKGAALAALDGIRAVTYHYRPGHDDGLDTERYGVIAEELPDIVATTDHKGLSTAHMVGLLLAALKDVKDELATLKAQQGLPA